MMLLKIMMVLMILNNIVCIFICIFNYNFFVIYFNNICKCYKFNDIGLDDFIVLKWYLNGLMLSWNDIKAVKL